MRTQTNKYSLNKKRKSMEKKAMTLATAKMKEAAMYYEKMLVTFGEAAELLDLTSNSQNEFYNMAAGLQEKIQLYLGKAVYEEMLAE